jgi:hypothetical protein
MACGGCAKRREEREAIRQQRIAEREAKRAARIEAAEAAKLKTGQGS